MFKLDDDLLKELGLGTLPPEEKNRMLAQIYETLELRVGMKLAEQMTNEQLDEFESYIDRQDEAGALKWLETNFPNYKDVVGEQLEALKTEIKQVAPQIIASIQQQAQAVPPPMPAGPVDPTLGAPSAQMPPPSYQPPAGPGSDQPSNAGFQAPAPYPSSQDPMAGSAMPPQGFPPAGQPPAPTQPFDPGQSANPAAQPPEDPASAA